MFSRLNLMKSIPIVSCSIYSLLYSYNFCDENSNKIQFPKNKKLSGNSYNANNPSEDRWIINENERMKDQLCRYAAVFDGHGGYQVADYSSRYISSLLQLYIQNPSQQSLVENNILEVFQVLESNIKDIVRQYYNQGYHDMIKVGSCVILAFQYENQLTIANLGDCRAVIGSENKEINKFYATRITADHNSREALEAFKLHLNHPNEPDIIKCKNPHACYVKGRLQLTRALGDFYLKDSEFNLPRGNKPRYLLLTMLYYFVFVNYYYLDHLLDYILHHMLDLYQIFINFVYKKKISFLFLQLMEFGIS